MTSTDSSRATTVSTTDLALIATFAALIAVCAVSAALPFGVNGVPVTLQLFGIFLAGAVLGAKRGFFTVVLYLVVGAAGLPIFAGGSSGIAQFSGVTGGYLFAFPFAALIVGLAVERAHRRNVAITAGVVVVGGLVAETVVWLVGATGISLYADTPLWATIKSSFAYVPADLAKLAAAAVVAAAVHRAFPALLTRGR
ncbi:biotin transporter BioY [Aeromicrobium ginsengisoli]|uniref:Biotin transporter n=1 Tax=Aeromicrobium ginsengisoli TaxID=363867 RepID=A0A5M4FCQ4_9ACTN|nr:biotin transporter BioY [Aeromicrobium ginsengisoli]KAA1396071.1 biotin transporter BioY [Aeromicrobium ginsengisoli]